MQCRQLPLSYDLILVYKILHGLTHSTLSSILQHAIHSLTSEGCDYRACVKAKGRHLEHSL